MKFCMMLCLWVFPHPISFARTASEMHGSRPSFSCSGQLSATERTICSDGELSAYDRAMAWAHARGWQPMETSGRGQSNWLMHRNDCSGDRRCILTAYQDWIGALTLEGAPAANYLRYVPINHRSGTFRSRPQQSPLRIDRQLGDWGELFIQPIGNRWYLFRALVTHNYDPLDGRGPNVSTGDATGLVQLSKGNGEWVSDLESPGSCRIRLNNSQENEWRIEERGVCSGVGATLTGIYGQRNRQTK